MLGFLKKLLGGGAADGPVDDRGVLSITPDDLESPDRLGPKLAAYAQMQDHIDEAVCHAEAELVRVRYASGIKAPCFMGQVIPAMAAMNTAEEVTAYLENRFADIDIQSQGRLLPVLKPASYIETAREQLRELGAGEDDPLPFWHADIAPGLILLLVYDSPTSMRSLGLEELKAQWAHPNDALQQARVELVDYLNDSEFGILSMYDGKLCQLKLDGNYEASLFFVSDVWDQQQEEFGAAPAAIFAARNLVYFVNSADPDAMDLLKTLAAHDDEEPAYAILPRQIWLYEDGGWTPYDDITERPSRLN